MPNLQYNVVYFLDFRYLLIYFILSFFLLFLLHLLLLLLIILLFLLYSIFFVCFFVYLSWGLTFNRSQPGHCSVTQETLTQNLQGFLENDSSREQRPVINNVLLCISSPVFWVEIRTLHNLACVVVDISRLNSVPLSLSLSHTLLLFSFFLLCFELHFAWLRNLEQTILRWRELERRGQNFIVTGQQHIWVKNVSPPFFFPLMGLFTLYVL